MSPPPLNLLPLRSFHLFYSFNGCSQQMFSLGVNGTAEVLDMRVCPFGTHEADWERVSVLACKADGEVKQVGGWMGCTSSLPYLAACLG